MFAITCPAQSVLAPKKICTRVGEHKRSVYRYRSNNNPSRERGEQCGHSDLEFNDAGAEGWEGVSIVALEIKKQTQRIATEHERP